METKEIKPSNVIKHALICPQMLDYINKQRVQMGKNILEDMNKQLFGDKDIKI